MSIELCEFGAAFLCNPVVVGEDFIEFGVEEICEGVCPEFTDPGGDFEFDGVWIILPLHDHCVEPFGGFAAPFGDELPVFQLLLGVQVLCRVKQRLRGELGKPEELLPGLCVRRGFCGLDKPVGECSLVEEGGLPRVPSYDPFREGRTESPLLRVQGGAGAPEQPDCVRLRGLRQESCGMGAEEPAAPRLVRIVAVRFE